MRQTPALLAITRALYQRTWGCGARGFKVRNAPPSPFNENGPAHVLRAAANAAMLRRGGGRTLAFAEVNPPTTGARPRRGLRAQRAA